MKQLQARLAFVVLSLATPSAFASPVQSCGEPARGFHLPGIDQGTVETSLVWDDGTGPALYVGGSFTRILDVPAAGIARWDGHTWSAVGAGLHGHVLALCVFQGELYAGGGFQNSVAHWNGVTWTPVPNPSSNAGVYALAEFQGELWVGGLWSNIGGLQSPMIARFDGSAWHAAPGAPYDDTVRALVVHDDGSGPALYAGGNFRNLGSYTGPYAFALARYDGVSWSQVGGGITTGPVTTGPPSPGYVYSLESADLGAGPRLYVGGQFAEAGGVPAVDIAAWDGVGYSSLGDANERVFELAAHDDGTGLALYAGGVFTDIGGVAAQRVARWNGAQWSALGPGLPAAVRMLGSFQGELFAGGDFDEVDGRVHTGLARWSGSAWSGFGVASGLPFPVRSFTQLDEGAGPQLIATLEAPNTGQTGGTASPAVCRWDPAGWAVLGDADRPVVASAVLDDGNGPSLYVAGPFLHIDGVPAQGFARWNGSTWTALSSLLAARRLRVLDVGGGPELYATAYLNPSAHGVPIGSYVARWTGTSWQPVGGLFSDQGNVSNGVKDVLVYDAGAGPELYATGTFLTSSGVQLDSVARWDAGASAWMPIGGLSGGGPLAGGVCLAVHDDGTGPQLVVGGTFTSAGGVPANHVARWNGSAWSALGAGLGTSGQGVVDMITHDDGTGAKLVATGNFGIGGARGLAAWDGVSWSALPSLTTPATTPTPELARTGIALASFDAGTGGGPDLWVGGEIRAIGPIEARNVARIEGCGWLGAPICAGDGSATACPCGNSSPVGENVGCLSSLGVGGRLVAQGEARISSDSYALDGSSMPDSTVLYFAGTSAVNGGGGAAFGDGLRCAGGSVRRLGLAVNAGGASFLPNPSSPAPLSVRDPVTPGAERVYQAWYRNAASFCTSATFNLTNAWRVTWSG